MAKVNPIQLQKFLKGTTYPAKRDALVQRAKDNGADETMCDTLGKLPDREFENPTAVSKAVRDVA